MKSLLYKSKLLLILFITNSFFTYGISKDIHTTIVTIIENEKKNNVTFKNKSVFKILTKMSTRSEFSFHVVKNDIIIGKKTSEYKIQQSDQKIKVTGTVTDEQNNPLVGTSILEKGTENGTVTDMNGDYTISVKSEDSILEFYFIGYVTQEVKVGTNTTINLVLRSKVAKLGEIVVVGYGTQHKSEVAGAVSTVKSTDIFTQGSNTVQQSLQGRISGVQVEAAGGDPGSGVRILVRGTASLNNNNPLYIVDGVQVDSINNLSSSDISSIEILKDASAAAIYGSRASNGVILITTTSGTKGKSTISFNAYYGFQYPSKLLDVLNGEEWARVSTTAHEAAGLPIAGPELEASGPGTDYQDLIYRTAPMENYNLSLGGGGDDYSFSVSGGYFNQDGIIKLTTYNRANLRIKTRYTKGIFEVGETVILSKEYWRGMGNGGGGQGGAAAGAAPRMIPVFKPYNADDPGGFDGARGNVVNVFNPLASLTLSEPETFSTKAIVNGYAQVSLIKGLKYKLNLGYTYTANFNSTYVYPYKVGTLFTNADADLSESRSETTLTLIENTLNYRKVINKHKFNLLVGYTFQDKKYRVLSGSKSGMPNEIKVIDAGTSQIVAGSNAYTSVLLSSLGRLSYSYDGKYIATAIVRRDGSSRFSKDNQYGIFPSISLAWNMSKESFFSPAKKIVNDAKLRASYGILGNQEFSDYQFSSKITVNTNYVAGNPQTLWPGSIQTAFANKDIKWESSSTLNIGTDLSLLNNKFDVAFDYFIQENTDVILQVPIPITSGASDNSPFFNAGKISNKGLEVFLGYNNVVKIGGEDLALKITSTFASVKNEVVALGTGSQEIFGNNPDHHSATATVTKAGVPVGSFSLIKTAGIFQTQEEIDNYTHNGEKIQPLANPGDIKFIDYNNDGKIDQSDRQLLGSPTPDFTFGFGGSLEWKGIDVNIFFQGTYGNKIYNGFRPSMEGMNLVMNYSRTTLNAWTPTNRNTDMPRAVINDPNGNGRTSDRFLEDGSYLRLKTLQVGYNIPSSILNRMKIVGCRVYVSFNNLFTISSYKGYNPDVGRTGSILDRGVDRPHIAYPLASSYLFGIQINI